MLGRSLYIVRCAFGAKRPMTEVLFLVPVKDRMAGSWAARDVLWQAVLQEI